MQILKRNALNRYSSVIRTFDGLFRSGDKNIPNVKCKTGCEIIHKKMKFKLFRKKHADELRVFFLVRKFLGYLKITLQSS